MPWGDPDFQGVWRYEAKIPLERHAEYAGRAVLTEALAAAEAPLLFASGDEHLLAGQCDIHSPADRRDRGGQRCAAYDGDEQLPKLGFSISVPGPLASR